MLTSISTPCLAQDAKEFRQIFNQAQTAFQNQDFTTAKKLFLSILKYERQLDKIHFNLGSTYYRTQEFQTAVSFFVKIPTSSSLYFLAQYNISLCYLKTHRDGLAAKHASNALTYASNDKQVQSIMRLSRLYKLPIQRKTAQLQGNISLGNHENIGIFSQTGDIDNSEKQDNFIHGQILTDFALRKWNFDVFYETYDYQKEDRFDYQGLSFGLSRIAAPWKIQIQKSWLDRENFLNTWRFDIHHRFHKTKFKPQILYNILYISDAGQEFEHLLGNRHQFTLQSKVSVINLVYQFTYNSRHDFSTPQVFKDYSPLIHSFQTSGLYQFKGIRLVPAIRFEQRNYQHNNFDPTLGSVRRNDQLLQFSFLAQKRLWRRVQFLLTYIHSKQNSNIAEFGYSSNLIQAGIHYSFKNM